MMVGTIWCPHPLPRRPRQVLRQSQGRRLWRGLCWLRGLGDGVRAPLPAPDRRRGPVVEGGLPRDSERLPLLRCERRDRPSQRWPPEGPPVRAAKPGLGRGLAGCQAHQTAADPPGLAKLTRQTASGPP
eukprot:gene797-biopygen2612